MEQLLELCDHAHIKHIHNYIEPKLQRDYISELPRELILLLLTYVRPKDLYKLAQVSHYFHQIANDPILWKNICKKSKIVVSLNGIKSIDKVSSQENETAKSNPKVNTRNRNINNDNMSYITNDECDEDEDDGDDYYSISSQNNCNNTNNNNNNNLQVNFNSLSCVSLNKKDGKHKIEDEDENYDESDDEEVDDDDDDVDDDEVEIDDDEELDDEEKSNFDIKHSETSELTSSNNPTTSSSGSRVRSPASPSSCSSTEQNKSNQNSQSSSQSKSGKLFLISQSVILTR